MTAKAVTGNRLADGLVVYLTSDHGWSERVADAAWSEDEAQQQALLEVAEAQAARAIVVAPYLFDVVVENGVPTPARNRERIRSLGPTNRTDVGKQAELESN